jgi:hypothetical protein
MMRYLAVAFFAVSLAACMQSESRPTPQTGALPGATGGMPADCGPNDARPACRSPSSSDQMMDEEY